MLLTRFKSIGRNEGFKFEGEFYKKIDINIAIKSLRGCKVSFTGDEIVGRG